MGKDKAMHHVLLTCQNHPELRWMCKEIAVNAIGQYNGARNIFYLGDKSEDASKPFDCRVTQPECDCSPHYLRFAPEAPYKPGAA